MSAAVSAPRRRRIVMTSTFPIHARTFGGQHRAFHLAEQLAEVADVTIVSLTEHGADTATYDLALGVREHTIMKTAAHAAVEAEVAARAAAPVGDILAATSTDRTPAYADALAAAARDADAILLVHPFLLPTVQAVAPDVTLLYDAPNAERRHKAAILPPSAERDRLVALVDDVERRTCAAARAVSTPSARDAEALRDDYGCDAIVVANGADTAGTPFVTGEQRERATKRWLTSMAEMRPEPAGAALAVFVGSHHEPNVVAARNITALAPRLPAVTVVIAGGVCEELPTDLPDNVLAAGWVTEHTKWGLLRAATVALNPIQSGWGTNVKVPECLAVGAPLVTTPLGARGFELSDGVHALVRPIEDFEPAIASLIADHDRRDVMAAEGRRLAEDAYSWPTVTAEWRAVVARTLDA